MTTSQNRKDFKGTSKKTENLFYGELDLLFVIWVTDPIVKIKLEIKMLKHRLIFSVITSELVGLVHRIIFWENIGHFLNLLFKNGANDYELTLYLFALYTCLRTHHFQA